MVLLYYLCLSQLSWFLARYTSIPIINASDLRFASEIVVSQLTYHPENYSLRFSGNKHYIGKRLKVQRNNPEA